jgi:hypothetical protein
MAVIQISKIQVRRGLQENLPQLSSGEMGWSVDERRLYIGNGTLVEGAPTVGVTEILTEYSNVILTASSIAANIVIAQLADAAAETLLDNTTANIGNITIPTVNSRIIDYNIIRGTDTRVGSIKVTNLNGAPVIEDDYTETANIGVALTFVANSSTPTSVTMSYTTSNSSGTSATLNYYIKTFA